jgi:asparagine synthase (glutamine-hydrolysing)
VCGIVAIFARDGAEVDSRLLLQMRESLSHRGPDDASAWTREPDQNVALAVRRLAIVDLTENGRQPMATEDGSVQVAFNGEIYNHRELRAELERRGHRFRSSCDAEVLPHLYEEHGTGLVERLVGKFAFVVWDEHRERLLLARDRLGVKPLYWLDDGRVFACASEIKALLPLLPRREVDEAALAQYLAFTVVAPARTLFRGVSKLAPATTMTVGRAGPEPPRRYWDPLLDRSHFEGAAPEREREVRRLLEQSVERRMMSDVPVGVLLSGGVDSSSVVALMSGLVDGPVKTFSVGYDVGGYDEFPWARLVSRRFGTLHHELRIDAGEFWRAVPAVVEHQDEPVEGPVGVSVYLVSRLVRDSGVTVLHLGEGGDELFAGYRHYARYRDVAAGSWRRFRSLPAPLRGALARAGAAALAPWARREDRRESLLRAARSDGRLWWGTGVAFQGTWLRRLLGEDRLRSLDGAGPDAVVSAIAADAERGGARDELDRIVYQDLRLRMPEGLLMRADRMTMASSVEGRIPFLDHDLVELGMTLPASDRIRDGVGKHVVKRAMEDVLPRELLWRRKQAFRTALPHWLRRELYGRAALLLETSALTESGLVDMAVARTLLEQHRRGRVDRTRQVWTLLQLSAWFDRWIAGRDLPATEAFA